MNICVITPLYPTHEGRGGFFFVEQLVIQFARLGHRCFVIAPANITSKYAIRHPYGEAYELRNVDDVNTIEIFRPRYYARNISFMGVSWATWSVKKAVERTIKKKHLKIDAFYCHFFWSGFIAWHYAKTNKIPMFVATGESEIQKLPKPCRSFSLEKFRIDTTGIICVSTKNKEEAIGFGYAVEDKCIVLHNGVDLNLFTKRDKYDCRSALGISKTEFVVVCVGDISDRKGQMRLLSAAERLNEEKHYDIKLILAGRGEIKKSSCLIYGGFVSHNDLPTYLNAADIYAIPTRWEGCCNSIIEAMACGLPIVSSNRSFNWDILNQDNSILIDPDNIDKIAEAIQRLYEDKGLRVELGKRALASAHGLSISERASKIIDFMNRKVKDEVSIA